MERQQHLKRDVRRPRAFSPLTLCPAQGGSWHDLPVSNYKMKVSRAVATANLKPKRTSCAAADISIDLEDSTLRSDNRQVDTTLEDVVAQIT